MKNYKIRTNNILVISFILLDSSVSFSCNVFTPSQALVCSESLFLSEVYFEYRGSVILSLHCLLAIFTARHCSLCLSLSCRANDDETTITKNNALHFNITLYSKLHRTTQNYIILLKIAILYKLIWAYCNSAASTSHVQGCTIQCG